MAITSVGYERAINYAALGSLLMHAGASYSVHGEDDFAASAGVGAREVALQPGVASGMGVKDTSDAITTVSGTAVAAGSRWDLIVLRRHWDADAAESSTSVAIIAGGPTPSIPARLTEPGEDDDQPLWLARFAAGQSVVQELIDLRVWHGDGGMAGKHLLVRDYLTRIGTRVWIQGITWVLGFNSSGDAAWVPDSVYVGTSAPPYVEGLAWIKVP